MESLPQDWVQLMAGLLNTCCILWSKHWFKKGRGLLSSSLTTPLAYICFGRHFSKNLSLVIQFLPHLPSLPFIQEHQRCPVITTCLKKRKNSWKAILYLFYSVPSGFSTLMPCFLWLTFFSQHNLYVCWFLFLYYLKYKVKQNTCSGRKEKIAGYA